MPRIARQCLGGHVYHVLNRGNERGTIFHKRGDARAFLKLLGEAKAEVPSVRLLGWCMMSNHWHLVLWPAGNGDVSAFMAWLTNAHVRRYRQHYQNAGTGHVYQGRFKSFPVKSDDLDLLRVLRYVEANPLRAGLVERAQDWSWSSLHGWPGGGDTALLDPWPIDRPPDWAALVNTPLDDGHVSRLRTSIARGRPLGPPDWVERTSLALGLTATIRLRGRPRRSPRKGDIQIIP